jgi:SAM-dependent methyltransferase
MLKPSREGDRFWYPITRHPLARVLKFRNFQRYLALLPRGGTVVDYGAGDRPYEELLLTRFSRYLAIDHEITNNSHHGRPDVWIRDGHVELPSESVACVVLTEVLEHIYDPRAALAECHRLLQPGGVIVGSVPFTRGEHEAPHDYYRYTSFALRRLFADSGFVVRELDYVGHLAAAAAVTFAETLGLGQKALQKVGLGLVGRLLMLLVRVPEFICYALDGTALDPQRIAQLRRHPLGFTFLAQKPPADGESPSRLPTTGTAIPPSRRPARFEFARQAWRHMRRDLGNVAGAMIGPVPRPERWLFIVGCYDSGTTLLHRLLAVHPDVGSMVDEGQYRTTELLRPADAGLARLWALQPERFRLDEHSIPGPDVDRIKRQWGFWFNDPRRRVLVEKTPANAARVRWLDRHFENAHFVAVIRNGYAVAEGIRRKAGHPLALAARQWARSNRIMLDDLAQVPRVLIVRYEDLAARPEETCAAVLSFVGLDPGLLSLENRTWRIHEYDAPVLDMNRQSIERLSAADRAIVREEAGDVLRELGYECGHDC